MSYSIASTEASSQSSASVYSDEDETFATRKKQSNNWWLRNAEKFSEAFCDGAEQRFSCGHGYKDNNNDDASDNFSIDDISSSDESTMEGEADGGSVLLEVPKGVPAAKKGQRKKSKKAPKSLIQEFKEKRIQEFMEEIPKTIVQKPKKPKETKEEKAKKAKKVQDNIKSYDFFAKFGVQEVKWEEGSTGSMKKKVFNHTAQGSHRGWGPSSRSSSPQKAAVPNKTQLLKEHLLPSDDEDTDEDTFDDTLTADSLMRELSLMDSVDKTFDDTTTLDDTYAEEEATYDEGRSCGSSQLPFDERSVRKSTKSTMRNTNEDLERELPSFGSSKKGKKNANTGIGYIAHDQSFGSSSYGSTMDRNKYSAKPQTFKPHVIRPQAVKAQAVKPQAIRPQAVEPKPIKPRPVTVAQHRKKNIDLGRRRSRSSSLTPQQFNYALNHTLRTLE